MDGSVRDHFDRHALSGNDSAPRCGKYIARHPDERDRIFLRARRGRMHFLLLFGFCLSSRIGA